MNASVKIERFSLRNADAYTLATIANCAKSGSARQIAARQLCAEKGVDYR